MKAQAKAYSTEKNLHLAPGIMRDCPSRGYAVGGYVVWMAVQGQVQAQEIQPVNRGAKPDRVIRNWGMVPEGRPWGAANGVAIDRDGMSVRVADRCGNGNGWMIPT